MFSTLTKLQAAIESGNAQTRNAPKPPTRLEWFRAQFARNYDNDPGPWEALQKRWEEFKEYAAEHAPRSSRRALADITGGETQAETTPHRRPIRSGSRGVPRFPTGQRPRRPPPLLPPPRVLPGGALRYVRIPTITQHTKVDVRAGQKQEANSQSMIVSTAAFEAEWYDGAVDIALEIIRTAELDVLNLVYNDLLGVYAKRIERRRSRRSKLAVSASPTRALPYAPIPTPTSLPTW